MLSMILQSSTVFFTVLSEARWPSADSDTLLGGFGLIVTRLQGTAFCGIYLWMFWYCNIGVLQGKSMCLEDQCVGNRRQSNGDELCREVRKIWCPSFNRYKLLVERLQIPSLALYLASMTLSVT